MTSISSIARPQISLAASSDRFERDNETKVGRRASNTVTTSKSTGRAIADALVESFGWFGAGTAIAYPAVSAAAALSIGGLTGLGCLAYFGIKWAIGGKIS